MNPAKTIQDYIKKKKISVRKFANLCDVHYMTIYNILNGSIPSQLTAAKMEKYSKGALRYEDLTDLPRKKRRWNSTSKFVECSIDHLPSDWGKIK